MHSKSKQYLVVGAGLAGCLTAWRLIGAGERVTIFGDTERANASDVAAGVINPVTGRWLVKTWNIDALLPEANTTYHRLETQFAETFYHQIPLRRYCQNEDDAKRMGRRMRNPRYADAFGRLLAPGASPRSAVDPFGSIEILNAAYVDLPKLQSVLRAYFRSLAVLNEEVFSHGDLYFENGLWIYRNEPYNSVIFAEGVGIKGNPWFGDLPMRPAKGETLVVSSTEPPLPRVLLHHKKWILPYPNGTYRVGATYDEIDLSDRPTETGKAELLGAANEFLTLDTELKVEQHMAGVRPGTVDARPLVGEHISAKGLYVLNGLGSKGASLAPEMSRQLVDCVLNGVPLDLEISIARFQDA